MTSDPTLCPICKSDSPTVNMHPWGEPCPDKFHPWTPPAETGRCGNEWPMKHGYFCQLPKGHSGDHESECPNPAFHQSWPDTPPAETKAGPSWTGDDWDRIDATTGLPEPAAPVSPPDMFSEEKIKEIARALGKRIGGGRWDAEFEKVLREHRGGTNAKTD